jgi:hypothetical protein
MYKIILTTTVTITSIMIMTLGQMANANSLNTPCSKLDEEIVNLEKKLIIKSKLLAQRKLEIEKLPPSSTSMKMKLTADTFVTAAENEATQNWIEVKRKEKNSTCANHR